MEHFRSADLAAVVAAEGRTTHRFLDAFSGATSCMVTLIKTPPGGGSPEGLHTHAVDQHFYVIEGTLRVEIAGDVRDAAAGTLIFIPAGTPHRNWNAGSVPSMVLAINAPVPDPDRPFATPAASG